jgi:hypothetical protein
MDLRGGDVVRHGISIVEIAGGLYNLVMPAKFDIKSYR